MLHIYAFIGLIFFAIIFTVSKAVGKKAALLFSFINIPFVVFISLYINRTWVDTVWLDGFIHVPLLNSISSGAFRLYDLVAPAGEHILLGYKLIFISNKIFFDLDMRLDPYLFMIASFFLSAVIFIELYKSSIIYSGPKYIIWVSFFSLAFICFNLTAPPLMLMSTQFALAVPLALLIGVSLDRCLSGQESHLGVAAIFFLILIYFLAFSGSYFPGLLAGLFIILVAPSKLKNKNIKILTILLLAICSILYIYFVFVIQKWPESTSLSNRIYDFLTTPKDTLLIYFSGIGASLFDQHTFEKNIYYLIYFGALFLLLSLVVLFGYIKNMHYKISRLPLFCMFYSIGIITVVRAGRSMNGDWAWIANEWYAFHLRLFPIGVMLASFSLIFGYFGLRLSQYIEVKKTTISQLFFAILSVVFILLTTLYSTIFQWERGPDIKNWLQQKQFALLLPGLINQEVNLWPLDQVNDARKYLSDNKLSVFSSRTEKEIFENSHGGILRLNNWYGDDWIGGAGALVFRQSKAGLLEFSYEIPNFISDSLIKITLNDELAFTGMVPSGQKKTFLGKTGPGINILKIESNREVIPKSVNANSDIRPLSLRVSEIKF